MFSLTGILTEPFGFATRATCPLTASSGIVTGEVSFMVLLMRVRYWPRAGI